MFKAAVVLFSGNSFFYLLLFARNLVVARLLSVEDYGIASAFTISVAIVEMLAALGLPQYIIQNEDGDNPRLQSNLHGFNFLRSFLPAGALFLAAYPMAAFFRIPELAWAFQLLAVSPIMLGLTHFDIHRVQRQMEYTPRILSNLIPAVISVVALWPLHHIFGDYRVMLYSLLIQWVLTAVFSHLLAKRSFKMTFDREIMMSVFRFGWPILLSSIVLFVIFNGEKLVVGRVLGLEVLALFAMGTTLTLTPTLVLETSIQSFFLPQLSKNQKNPAEFQRLSMAIIQAYLLLGLMFVIGVVLLGGPVVHLLLGAKYEALIPILPWLALLQVLRMFKAGGNAISLAMSQTENSMIAGLARVFVLPFAWYAAVETGDFLSIVWIATVGELIGFGLSIGLIWWRLGISTRPIALSVGLTLICMVLVGLYASLKYMTASSVVSLGVVLVLIFAVSLVAACSMQHLRHYVARRGGV